MKNLLSKGDKISIAILLLMLLAILCAPNISAQNKQKENKYCIERGHILSDSIIMSSSKASYIKDTPLYTLRITLAGTETHYRCERCGEIIVIKDEPRIDTIWRKPQICDTLLSSI